MGDKVTNKEFPDQKQRVAVCYSQYSKKEHQDSSEIRYFNEFSVKNTEINAEKGIISGVSVITEGDAKGHGMLVDSTTLQQVKDCAEGYKGGLKVKLNHGSGVESICGALKNFRIEGNQLLADLHLLKSHSEYHHILELAEKMADTFGFSISFSGQDETIDEKTFARCSELYSADIVTEPAANEKGLFEKKTISVDSQNNNNTQQNFMDPKQFEEFKTSFEAQFKTISDRLEALEKSHAEFKSKKALDDQEPDADDKDGKKKDKKDSKMEAVINAEISKQLSQIGVKSVTTSVATTTEAVKTEVEVKTFEQIVSEKVKEGMKKTDAIKFCIKSNEKEYLEAVSRGIKQI